MPQSEYLCLKQANDFFPLVDRILVRPIIEEEKILLADEDRARPLRGHVVAVGPGTSIFGIFRRQCAVRVGDVILYGKYAGNDFDFSGEKLVIMREEEVLGRSILGRSLYNSQSKGQV